MSSPTITDPVLLAFAEEIGPRDAVTIRGGGTHWDVGGSPLDEAREVAAPIGIVDLRPDEMVAHVRAGTPVSELHEALAHHGQRTSLPAETGSTVGGVIAVGRSGISRLGRGHARDAVLQLRHVAADGRLVTAGGPTVKNVSGFDMCRLLFGSLGTLGCIGDAILRTQPLPEVEQWYRLSGVDPQAVLDGASTAASVLWDGTTVWTQLSGYRVDVEDDLEQLKNPVESEPPPLPPHRWSRRSTELRRLGAETHGFIAEVGAGVAHCGCADPEPDPLPAGVKALNTRVRDVFDPERRFNPGRSVI